MSRCINDLPKFGLESTVPYTVTLTTAGDYYCLCDATLSVTMSQYFTADPVTGVFTYTFDQDMILRFVGDTGVSVNAACEVEFCLFLNGVDEVCSRLGFVASAKIGSMGVNHVFTLTKGDDLKIQATSDTNAIALTVDSFQVSFA